MLCADMRLFLYCNFREIGNISSPLHAPLLRRLEIEGEKLNANKVNVVCTVYKKSDHKYHDKFIYIVNGKSQVCKNIRYISNVWMNLPRYNYSNRMLIMDSIKIVNGHTSPISLG